MLLRGSDDFIKPLWRAIETEDDPETLIQLLEIGAIAGVYGIEDLIAQKSAQHPDVAARLLAIHGSKAAIDKLLQLPHREEHEVQLEAAWQWLSGKHLKIDPHLRLVQPESAEQSGSSRHWWYAIRPTLEDGQRLIFGQVMTAKLVESAIINWTGQFSTSLISAAVLVAEATGESQRAMFVANQTCHAGRKRRISMIQLDNKTGVSAELFPGWSRTGQRQQTLVVKSGFKFDEKGKLRPTTLPIIDADEYRDDPENSSLCAAGEIMPYKQGAELYLYGSAQPTAERFGSRGIAVSLQQEQQHWHKELQIFGIRHWQKKLLTGHPPAKPQALDSELELGYEKAYGGFDPHNKDAYCAANPAGCGLQPAWFGAPRG